MSNFWGWYFGAAGLFDVLFVLGVGTWFWRRFIRDDGATRKDSQ
jgi:hypothetical protein